MNTLVHLRSIVYRDDKGPNTTVLFINYQPCTHNGYSPNALDWHGWWHKPVYYQHFVRFEMDFVSLVLYCLRCRRIEDEAAITLQGCRGLQIPGIAAMADFIEHEWCTIQCQWFCKISHERVLTRYQSSISLSSADGDRVS